MLFIVGRELRRFRFTANVGRFDGHNQRAASARTKKLKSPSSFNAIFMLRTLSYFLTLCYCPYDANVDALRSLPSKSIRLLLIHAKPLFL